MKKQGREIAAAIRQSGGKLMNWTSEYPTEPGFYWVRNLETILGRELKEQIVLVGVEGNVRQIGTARPLYKFKILSAEWQGPIEPEESRPILPNFWRSIKIACRDCNETKGSFVSWNLGEVDGKPLFGIICRDCWIKRLTPEQRKIYMV